MKTGLYFGSFNPIHMGHQAIAEAMLKHTGMEKVWFVVSPQNPLKPAPDLIDDSLRLLMVSLAVAENPAFKVCDVEFNLPKPSYTSHTLKVLAKQYPNLEFSLIIGQDNLEVFHQWYEFEWILEHYEILVYPRTGSKTSRFDNYPDVHFVPAPLLKISSTQIRKLIAEGKDVSHLVSPKVWRYLHEHNFYK